jgi:hypothetical protein
MIPAHAISKVGLDFLTEFSAEFNAAYVTAVEVDWAKRFGIFSGSGALKTVFMLALEGAGYVPRKGDDPMRDLGEVSLSCMPTPWVDGVKALATKVEASDFTGFNMAPGDMARAALRFPNKLAATMLESGNYIDLYREESPGGSTASTMGLFDNAHPVNIYDSSKGTFDNLRVPGTGMTTAWVEATKTRFRTKLGPSGARMGLEFNALLTPGARVEEARNIFEKDMVIEAIVEAGANVGGAAMPNRHKGTVEVIVCNDLTNADVVYPFDKKSSAKPWVTQMTPITQLMFDKTSDFYKHTLMLGLKFVFDAVCVGGIPVAIEKHTLS